MLSENYKNNKVIYPENIGSIISGILNDYGFKETDEEVVQKLLNKKPVVAGVVAKIIKEAAEGIISQNQIALALEKNLNIPKKISEQMSQDIIIKALSLLKKTISKKKEVSEKKPFSEKGEQKIEKTPEKTFEQDTYREPIE